MLIFSSWSCKSFSKIKKIWKYYCGSYDKCRHKILQKNFFDYYREKKFLKRLNVKKIIPLNGLEYTKIAKKYQLDYFVHGNDWIKGPQSKERKILIKTMRKWNGKVLEFKYTKNVSSSKIKKKLLITKK